jgi:hypothetical protein
MLMFVEIISLINYSQFYHQSTIPNWTVNLSGKRFIDNVGLFGIFLGEDGFREIL